jgi:hypothetical protein
VKVGSASLRQAVEPEASSASSPLLPDKHGKLTGSLLCINYLCFSTTTLSLLFYAWYDFETSYYGHLAACRNQSLYSLTSLLQMICEKVWVLKRKCFSKWVWWRVVTLLTFERDDQGLPGLGEGLRWWLNWFRCEHEGLSLSPKDRFVITAYLYSYQVQPLKGCMGGRSIWTCTVQTLGLWWLGSTGRIRRGNVLSGLDMVVAWLLLV